MRWFKHLSDSSADFFVRDLERKFGDAGYAFWFKTLELIAAQGETGKLSISWANLCEKLHKRRSAVEQMLDFCATSGKLSVTKGELLVKIECAKFAEMADNYSKYGGKEKKRLQRQLVDTSNQNVEAEEKEKKNTSPPVALKQVFGSAITDGAFTLSLDDEEFARLLSEVTQIINEENAGRTNRFTWTSKPGASFEMDVRSLTIQFRDEKKRELLLRAHNLLGGRLSWPEFLKVAIRYTIRTSQKQPIRNPIGFIHRMLEQPEQLHSAASDGVLAARAPSSRTTGRVCV